MVGQLSLYIKVFYGMTTLYHQKQYLTLLSLVSETLLASLLFICLSSSALASRNSFLQFSRSRFTLSFSNFSSS